MTELLVAYLADYGVALLFVTTLFSCLALPVPSSILMLTGGAFVATGDLQLGPVVAAAFLGAVLGDLTGYIIGSHLRAPLYAFMKRNAKREKLLDKAESMLAKRGMIGVYLSRWLFSPLGPYVNFTAGATGMPRLGFFIAGALGEATWVAIYVGLGYAFADNLTMAAELASDTLGLIAAVVVMLGTGAWMYSQNRKKAQLDPAE